MTDVDQIRNLVSGFCLAVDTKDAARWDDLFADDASLLHQTEVLVAGRDALRPWLEQRTLGGSHLTLNLHVTMDGDIARSVANYLILGEDLTIQGAGYYRSEFRRMADGWKITEWRVLPRDAAPSMLAT